MHLFWFQMWLETQACSFYGFKINGELTSGKLLLHTDVFCWYSSISTLICCIISRRLSWLWCVLPPVTCVSGISLLSLVLVLPLGVCVFTCAVTSLLFFFCPRIPAWHFVTRSSQCSAIVTSRRNCQISIPAQPQKLKVRHANSASVRCLWSPVPKVS